MDTHATQSIVNANPGGFVGWQEEQIGVARAMGNAVADATYLYTMYQSAVAGMNQTAACFTADTLIKTAEGDRKISEIAVSDLVYSENVDTAEVEYKTVQKVFVRETSSLVHVFVGETEIETTSEHPFYVLSEGWVDAGELRVGDSVQLVDGSTETVRTIEMEELDAPIAVYNFEVADWHTYFVGGIGVLVHNACGEESVNANWKSVKEFGHTFNTHGSGSSNTNALSGRAASTGQNQGQWLNNLHAANYIKSLGDIETVTTVSIPDGMGQVITPTGEIFPATNAVIVPSATGIKTAYPLR